MRKVILGQDIEGNLSGSKGVTMDNFSISMKGWWKMVISHLKHSYLNWKMNPYRRKILQFFIFFSIFFCEFGFSWLSFGLNRMIQVHDMTINFSFFSSFVLMIRLLRATMHAIDDLPDWGISSHVRIVLKGWSVSSRVVHVISVQRKDMAQKISTYVSKKRGYGLKDCWYHFC